MRFLLRLLWFVPTFSFAGTSAPAALPEAPYHLIDITPPASFADIPDDALEVVTSFFSNDRATLIALTRVNRAMHRTVERHVSQRFTSSYRPQLHRDRKDIAKAISLARTALQEGWRP